MRRSSSSTSRSRGSKAKSSKWKRLPGRRVLRGRQRQGRGTHGRGRVTIFDSVGFALEDYSALRFLHRCSTKSAAPRRQIDLVPELEDPKDLFGGTLGAGIARAAAARIA
jgi:hypothetical protein